MNDPKISVGLPVYNGVNFIRPAIQSLLNQDYRDFELIISDNASTDETEAICREFAGIDSRIRYWRNDVNIGAAGNYNRVFSLARGEYFKWQAHDDECHPAMLRRCVEAFDDAPSSVTMIYPRGELIDEQGKTLASGLDCIATHDSRPHRRMAHVIWRLNMHDPIFGLIRSDYLRKTGLIGSFFGADNVLLSELAMLGEIREVEEVLFRLRAHPKRSMKVHPSARARAAWYNPSAAHRFFVLPNWERMVLEAIMAALRSPLPPVEKAKCCMAAVGVHYWRRFKNAGGRWKARLKAEMGLTPSKEGVAS